MLEYNKQLEEQRLNTARRISHEEQDISDLNRLISAQREYLNGEGFPEDQVERAVSPLICWLMGREEELSELRKLPF